MINFTHKSTHTAQKSGDGLYTTTEIIATVIKIEALNYSLSQGYNCYISHSEIELGTDGSIFYLKMATIFMSKDLNFRTKIYHLY